jgi:hypothetical protein
MRQITKIYIYFNLSFKYSYYQGLFAPLKYDKYKQLASIFSIYSSITRQDPPPAALFTNLSGMSFSRHANDSHADINSASKVIRRAIMLRFFLLFKETTRIHI